MSSRNPTLQELQQGFKECKLCKGILLTEAGFEVATRACTFCGQHIASKEEFFNVPVEILSK